MNKRLLSATLLLTLTACSSDSDEAKQQDVNSILSDHAGYYTATINQQQELKWLRLSVSDLAANLVITDEIEHSKVMMATVADEQLLFASNDNCFVSDETFICTIAGEEVSLNKMIASPSQTLAKLAGDYQLRIDNDVVDINLDSQGRFVSQYKGCNLTGELVMGAGFFTLLSDSNACETQENIGVVYVNTYQPDPTMLEVYAENSLFTGDWVKR